MKGGKAKSGTNHADNKLSVKKSKKSAKDPNKPKRPASAYFVFLEDFRKQYKEQNPNNKSIAAVAKAAGEKWKSMSETDKAPYVEKSGERKKEYEKSMIAYNKKQAAGTENGEEDSDKSKSEVNDEAMDGSDEEEED